MTTTHHQPNQHHTITLHQPASARCPCGARLCDVRGPSDLDIKCRRCARLLRIRLAGEARKE